MKFKKLINKKKKKEYQLTFHAKIRDYIIWRLVKRE